LKPVRRLSPIGTYFITALSWERRPIFRAEPMARLLIDTLYSYRAQSKYLLHEFVVMPEHIHLLITPALGVTIERVMQFIKGGYSYRVGKELGSRTEIWQQSFTDHRIRDEGDFFRHRDYIRENPVKRRLAETPHAYPYCSAFPGFDLDEFPSAAKAAVSES
jgi:putative transposase